MQEMNRNSSVSVGTDNVVISEAKNVLVNYRSFFLITNTSTGGQVVTLTFTDEAGAGSGIVLNAGGFHGEAIDQGFTPTNDRICAISSAAGGTVAISERIIQGKLPGRID